MNDCQKLEEVIRYRVNMGKCETGDPCDYEYTCRIHKISWFLREGSKDLKKVRREFLPVGWAIPLEEEP